MARDGDARIVCPEIRESERNADRLAFELLAPADVVMQRLDLKSALRTEFGLPERQANEYAAMLRPAPEPSDPLVRKLRQF